jgi:DNA polymerase-3 subunit chi
MTQVDFYILEAQADGDRYQLACRVAEKARRAGRRVLIHTPVATESRHVDTLFWTLWEQSFIPHGQLGRDDPSLNPILIGDGSSDAGEHEVLINLAVEVPVFFSRFERLIECVDHDDAVKAAGRERFRFYREHGYPLQTHNIA